MINSKRNLAILVSMLLVAAGLGVFLLLRGGEEESGDSGGGNRKIEEVNTIPIVDRPFTAIVPRADGREVQLTVLGLAEAVRVDYELEYQAGTLLQGAFGMIDFTREEAPVVRNILLGSCSAGGKCSYHEDVNGGTILLRYQNGESLALKSEWNFQRMDNEEGAFTSRDAKFTFDAGERGFSPGTFVIVAQTMGLPAPADGEVVGGPYAVFLPKGIAMNAKEATLTMRTNSDDPNLRLLGFAEDGWLEYESELSGKTLEATVDRATTFIAVVPESAAEGQE